MNTTKNIMIENEIKRLREIAEQISNNLKNHATNEHKYSAECCPGKYACTLHKRHISKLWDKFYNTEDYIIKILKKEEEC